MRFLDATVCLALAAEIHQCDSGVKATAQRLAKLLERRHRHFIYEIINSRSPYLHVLAVIATLPESVFTMDPSPVPPPHVQMAQAKLAQESAGH